MVRAYREAMRSFAGMRTLDVWYARQDVDDIARQWASQVGAKPLKRFERNIAKARAKDSLRAFEKLTERVDGEPRFVSDPPVLMPVEEVVPPGKIDQVER